MRYNYLKNYREVIKLIKVLYGKKGTGKSRRLIAMANEANAERSENSVFIDKDCDRMYELNRSIRFINSSDFNISGPKMFTGFASGIAAQDFDLEAIYINSLMKVVKHPLDELADMFDYLNSFSEKNNVALYISVSSEDEVPDFLEKYLI